MHKFSVWITTSSNESGNKVVATIRDMFPNEVSALGNILSAVTSKSKGTLVALSLNLNNNQFEDDYTGGCQNLKTKILDKITSDYISIIVSITNGSSWKLSAPEEKHTDYTNKPKFAALDDKENKKPNNISSNNEKELPLKELASIVQSSLSLSETFFKVTKRDRERILDKIEEKLSAQL